MGISCWTKILIYICRSEGVTLTRFYRFYGKSRRHRGVVFIAYLANYMKFPSFSYLDRTLYILHFLKYLQKILRYPNLNNFWLWFLTLLTDFHKFSLTFDHDQFFSICIISRDIREGYHPMTFQRNRSGSNFPY